MRVATSMMYSFVRSSLADITRDMNKASETVITGKRINALSDDPMDMVKAAGIKSTLNGLKQVDRNISVGNNWLTASENALTQAQDLISESKTLALQMANAPISSGNRKDAAVMVEQTMEQMMSLANTMVDGRYVFSGNRTDVPSFAVETDETGENIVYQGDNHPFSINIGTDSLIEIGGDGGEIFNQIFDTLAQFKTALEEDDLDSINSVLDTVAAASDIKGEITNPGSDSTSAEIKVTFEDLLEGQTFTAAGRTITAGTGGATAEEVGKAFATGSDEGKAIVSAMGTVAAEGTVTPATPTGTASDVDATAVTYEATDTLDMTGLATDDTIEVEIDDTAYTFTYDGTDWGDTDNAAAAGFTVAIDSSTASSTGVTVEADSTFTLNSVAGAVADDGSFDGYYVTQGSTDDVVILTASGNGEVTSFTVTGGTAIVSLDEHFDHLNSAITAVGSKMSRLDMKSSIFQEMKINETEKLSAVEDADIIAAITRLEQMQLTYQAALSSSSKLMSMNLLDYLR